jgi:hypothetical protein
MAAGVQKQWTLLIYANGNNELEPEMWQAKLDAEKTGSSHDVDAIMQIGREDRQLIRILRPMDILPDASERWVGVRRYYIKKNQSDLINDLGSINMAHPRSLYDFIKWGTENYPARHYMLILGGHALQFVGMMTDYSQNIPYIMGIPEMVKALNLLKKDTGKNIDLLVLDTCHMNSVEVIYELGQDEDHAVQNVITFIGEGPIAGLPYDSLIYLVQKNIDNDVAYIIKQIIDLLHFDLVAFEVNHKKLQNIERAAHELDRHHLNGDGQEEANVLDTRCLDNKLASIIIHSKCISQKKCHAIMMAATMVSPPLAHFYHRLTFARNNCWARLRLNEFKDNDYAANMRLELVPISLLKETLYCFIAIMNQKLDQQRLEMILEELLIYKNWQMN